MKHRSDGATALLGMPGVATPSMVDSQAAELSAVRAAALASAGVRSRSGSWGRCSL